MNIKGILPEYIDYLNKKNRSDGTIKEYSKDLKMLNQFLLTKYTNLIAIEEITIRDLNDYLNMLVLQKGYKAASRNRQLNTIRAFFKYCSKQEYMEKNIANRLELMEVEKKERSYLTADEVNKLIDAIPHRLIKLVVATLFYTGLRISECLSLTVDDIDFENNKIVVKKGKGNKRREIPLNSQLEGLIKDYINRWRTDIGGNSLFQTEKTGKLSDVYVNRVIKMAAKNLGWKKKVTCHVLRHSFASALVEKNVNLVAIKELLGHADLKTTSAYTHIQKEILEDAIKTLKL